MGGVGLKNIPYFDEDDKSPLYHKIQNHILGRIESGEFEVGDMLPPEPELAEYYGVSRITVKRALLELSNEGIIVRKQGLSLIHIFLIKASAPHKAAGHFVLWAQACPRPSRASYSTTMPIEGPGFLLS